MTCLFASPVTEAVVIHTWVLNDINPEGKLLMLCI